MTIIEKALERLGRVGGYDDVICWSVDPVTADFHRLQIINDALAALIRVTARPWHSEGVSWCRSCQRRIENHAPDCALIQLCEAVVGEKA